jgi:hypothetical protein
MLGAVHMTMGLHFDMDELFQHLVTIDGNKGKTKVRLITSTQVCLQSTDNHRLT